MNIQQYIERNKNNQKSFLEFLDNSKDENCDIYNQYIKDLQNVGSRYELGIVLDFILKIANNHHRNKDFYNKIDKVLLSFKDDIKQYYTNFELFRRFRSNKRILYFFIKEGILEIDEFVAQKLLSDKCKEEGYHVYFYPELQPFMDIYTKCETEQKFKKYNQNGINLFDLQRKVGQNESNISSYIRSDSLTEYLSYVKDRRIQYTTTIEKSIFETNQFLLDKTPTILEYAAFFGSYQIFSHLVKNEKAKLSPSIWIYAIHGNDERILKLIQEKKVRPEDTTYIKCIKESIKCHHNSIAEYIQTKIIRTQSIEDYKVKAKSIKYINYEYFPNDLTNPFYFYKLCQFNYVTLVGILLRFKAINTGYVVILKVFFLNKISNEFIFIKFQIIFFNSILIFIF